MPSKIRKRGKTRWLGRVQKDGKILQKLWDTKKQALSWETAMRKADWSKTNMASSLGEWALAYLNYSTKFSDKAYQEKVKAFKEFFAAQGLDGEPIVRPSDGVDTLTPGRVLAALTVQFENRSGYAANKDRKNLVAAWNWGIKYLGLPSANPCLVDHFPAEQQPRNIPSEEDFWKVYNVAEGQDQVMLLTFLLLGARRGEVFRLKWADIDFNENRVRLSTRKRKDGSLEYDWLPMTEALKAKLLWWCEHRVFKEEAHVFVCDEKTPFCRAHYGKTVQVSAPTHEEAL